jgi:hypothetical protein
LSFPSRSDLEAYINTKKEVAEAQKTLQTSNKNNNMRGSNCLRSGRPANSMEQDSFDSFDDIEEMVMASNNLSLSPNNSNSEANRDSLNVSGEEDELPKSIIVTNVDLTVFDIVDIKVRRAYIFFFINFFLNFNFLK